ncbi:glycerophosphodiester phosphodiesterase family protein [Microbacterium sp.]|uniref:glycerophosphodiester phosphodiesterase n=1 Tax=Microbacterium sp. TaxID=51671 RepID=UPI003F6E95C8
MAVLPLPVATGDFSTSTNSNGTSLTPAKPVNLADGDVMFAVAHNHNNSGTFTPASGWTLLFAFTSRKGGLYYKRVPTASSEGATSTWTWSLPGRVVVTIWRQNGFDATTLLDVVAGSETAGASGSVTLGAISPAQAGDLALAVVFANPGASTGATFSWGNGFADLGMGPVGVTNGTAASVIGVGYKQLSSSGSTGTTTVTGTGTPSGTATPAGFMVTLRLSAAVAVSVGLSGSGSLSAGASPALPSSPVLGGEGTLSAIPAGPNVSVGLSGSGSLSAAVAPTLPKTVALSGSGTLSAAPTVIAASGAAALSGSGQLEAHATRPIDLWMANTPMWIAHRGGSLSWPEHTMLAYDQAVAWRNDLALEVSVWKSADGVWVCNHDNAPSDNAVWANPGVGNITARNWTGDLANIYSTVGSSPMIRLVDLLAKYGGSHILVIDNKASTDMTGFLNLLDSYAGADRYIIKGFYTDSAKASAARARGYQTWGYYYEADGGNVASTHANWTILGMNNSANATAWGQVKAPGKPVWAHIIQNMTAWNSVQTYTPQGYMVSGVQAVVPQTPAAAALSGSGALVANPLPRVAVTPALSGSGALTAAAVPRAGAAPSLSGAGQLSASTGASGSAAPALSGSGTLTAAKLPSMSVPSSPAGSGELVASGRPGLSRSPALSGEGLLEAGGRPSFDRAPALGGEGTLTVVTGGNTPSPMVAYLNDARVQLRIGEQTFHFG